MGKPRIPNQKKNYNELNKRLSRYVTLVQSVFDKTSSDMCKNIEATGYDGSKPFRFSDYPELKSKVNDMQSNFYQAVTAIVHRGTSDEWKHSNHIQDLLANDVLKAYGAKVNGKKYKVYYQTNSDALQAFQQRKIGGLSLSQNIWNLSHDYKSEMECAISSAIQKGTSAVTLSKRVAKYLRDFPSLKKDFKKTFGKAANISSCEYRTARLARSEINMAYRTAEQKRWQQMDFIVGIEIKTSGSHGNEVSDICDTLQGEYPKDFKWTGWHPNCKCYQVPILKDEDEFFADDDEPSQNEVDDVPDNFKEFVNDNRDKIESSISNGNSPYWVRDNMEAVTGSIKEEKPKRTLLEEERIMLLWEGRKVSIANGTHAKITEMRKVAKIYKYDISVFEDAYSKAEDEFDILDAYENARKDRKLNILISAYKRHQRRTIDEISEIRQRLDARSLFNDSMSMREEALKASIIMQKMPIVSKDLYYLSGHGTLDAFTDYYKKCYRDYLEVKKTYSGLANGKTGKMFDELDEIFGKNGGISKRIADLRSRADIIQNSSSLSVESAEMRFRALMPKSVHIEFGGINIDAELVDAVRNSSVRNMTLAPRIEEKINFIGTNSSQCKIIEEYYYSTRKDIFCFNGMDEVSKREFFEKILYEDGFAESLRKKYMPKMLSGEIDGAEWMKFCDLVDVGEKVRKRAPFLISKGTTAYSDPWIPSSVMPIKTNGICYNNGFGNSTYHRQSNMRCAKSGWHPQGTERLESTFDHEFGHKIDELLDIRSESQLVKLHNAVSWEIADKLSEYAEKNIKEFIAEGWSEYLNNPNPRSVARRIGSIIEGRVGKQVKSSNQLSTDLSKAITDEEYKRLKKNGFKILSKTDHFVNEYNESPARNLDLESYSMFFVRFAKDNGIILQEKSVIVDGAKVKVKIKGSKTGVDDGIFELGRTFKYDKNETIAVHDYITLPKDMREKGHSRKLMKHCYNTYREAGIYRIELKAGLDNGSVVWSKYGFCTDYETIQGIIESSYLTIQERIDAMNTIKLYKQTGIVPLNELVYKDYGEKLLETATWKGFIDFRDDTQKTHFEMMINKKK